MQLSPHGSMITKHLSRNRENKLYLSHNTLPFRPHRCTTGHLRMRVAKVLAMEAKVSFHIAVPTALRVKSTHRLY